jgi:hypothetical protein
MLRIRKSRPQHNHEVPNICCRKSSAVQPITDDTKEPIDSSKENDDSYMQKIKSQTEDIIKPEDDKRSYRGIELTNGLKILLVSDENLLSAFVSMEVNVGKERGLFDCCEQLGDIFAF